MPLPFDLADIINKVESLLWRWAFHVGVEMCLCARCIHMSPIVTTFSHTCLFFTFLWLNSYSKQRPYQFHVFIHSCLQVWIISVLVQSYMSHFQTQTFRHIFRSLSFLYAERSRRSSESDGTVRRELRLGRSCRRPDITLTFWCRDYVFLFTVHQHLHQPESPKALTSSSGTSIYTCHLFVILRCLYSFTSVACQNHPRHAHLPWKYINIILLLCNIVFLKYLWFIFITFTYWLLHLHTSIYINWLDYMTLNAEVIHTFSPCFELCCSH